MTEFSKDDAWKQEEDRQRRYSNLHVGKIEQLSEKPWIPTPEELGQLMERDVKRETDTITAALSARHEAAVGHEVLEQLNHGLNSLVIAAEQGDLTTVIATTQDLQRLVYQYLR